MRMISSFSVSSSEACDSTDEAIFYPRTLPGVRLRHPYSSQHASRPKAYVEGTLDYTADVDGYYVISIWVAERYELVVRWQYVYATTSRWHNRVAVSGQSKCEGTSGPGSLRSNPVAPTS